MTTPNWGTVQPDGPDSGVPSNIGKKGEPESFGMLTAEGNRIVAAIVAECRKKRAGVYGVGNETEHLALVRLRTLAKTEGFSEAGGEIVRARVLNAVRKR